MGFVLAVFPLKYGFIIVQNIMYKEECLIKYSLPHIKSCIHLQRAQEYHKYGSHVITIVTMKSLHVYTGILSVKFQFPVML